MHIPMSNITSAVAEAISTTELPRIEDDLGQEEEEGMSAGDIVFWVFISLIVIAVLCCRAVEVARMNGEDTHNGVLAANPYMSEEAKQKGCQSPEYVDALKHYVWVYI